MQFKCQKYFCFKLFSLVLIQTIQFSISTQLSSIYPIDRTLSGATTERERERERKRRKDPLYKENSSETTTQKIEIWTYHKHDSLTYWHKITLYGLRCHKNQSYLFFYTNTTSWKCAQLIYSPAEVSWLECMSAWG